MEYTERNRSPYTEVKKEVMKRTPVVNLLGGPGTGKSTTAAFLFALLKGEGVNAELITEFAKDLTWEGRDAALAFQPYVTAKQMWRQHRVDGKVDVIITDSPIILGLVYQGEGCTTSFQNFVTETYRNYRNLTIFLKRNPDVHPYNPIGRNQTEEEALIKDEEILNMLRKYGIPYQELPILEGLGTAEKIVDQVNYYLERGPWAEKVPYFGMWEHKNGQTKVLYESEPFPAGTRKEEWVLLHQSVHIPEYE